MKKLKQILPLTLGLLLCLSLAAPALADVIYEPENAFYKSHQDECVHSEKNYIVSASGAAVCTKPGGKTLGTYEAGTTIYADYLYTDPRTGDVWGSCMFRSDSGWEDGWVCLTGMQVVYDNEDFQTEYGAAFYSPEENTDAPTICLCDTPVVLWRYPGAETPLNTLDMWAGEDADDNAREEMTLWFHTLFDDEDGRQWGYLGYWRGWRSGWICLSDPAEENLPVRAVTPIYVEKAEGGAGGSASQVWLAIGLVAAVAVVTAVLLMLRKKKSAGK